MREGNPAKSASARKDGFLMLGTGRPLLAKVMVTSIIAPENSDPLVVFRDSAIIRSAERIREADLC